MFWALEAGFQLPLIGVIIGYPSGFGHSLYLTALFILLYQGPSCSCPLSLPSFLSSSVSKARTLIARLDITSRSMSWDATGGNLGSA